MTECIHGLELASCDVCSPKPEPVAPPKAVRQARPAATPAPKRSVVNRDSMRAHVVIPVDHFADALEDGSLVDPIYYIGPEETAWLEKRRARDIGKQVVLVTTFAAVAGQDELPMSAVQLVVVGNTVAQELVKGLLSDSPYSPRVSVHPAWFTAPE